jgi:cytochrome c
MKRLLMCFTAVGILTLATSPVFAAGDATNGKKVYEEECSDCHSVNAGKNKKGPSFFNVVGRKSASIADFNYSDAMRAKNTVWTPEAISEYIKAPKKSVPGGKMKYDGLDDEKSRTDVIAYISTLH